MRQFFRSGVISRSPGEAASSRTVLAANDFTYLGAVRVPLDNADPYVRFGYSYGTTITTRRVGGDLHLMLGMSQAGEAVPARLIELVYDQTPNTTIGSAGRLSTYKVWGDIYGSRRQVQDSNGIRHLGMHWDGEKLIWSWGPQYSGIHERSLGATTFDGTTSSTSYGPWRTECHAKQSNGYMIAVPSDKQSLFGGKNVMIGGIQTSINALSTWGHSLNAFDSSGLLSLAADSYLDDTERSVETLEVMTANFDNRMERDPTWQQCAKDSAELGYTCTSPQLYEPINEVSDIDTGNGCAWIQNTTKHGIVFVTIMVDRVNNADFRNTHYDGDDLPHNWYATAGSPCCHGHTALLAGTGPHTPSLVPQFWIYDPDDLSDGGLTAIQRANNPVVKHKHLYDYHSNFPYSVNDYYETGCAYDATDRLLFVPMAGQDVGSQFESLPVVHVFQVAD